MKAVVSSVCTTSDGICRCLSPNWQGATPLDGGSAEMHSTGYEGVRGYYGVDTDCASNSRSAASANALALGCRSSGSAAAERSALDFPTSPIS